MENLITNTAIHLIGCLIGYLAIKKAFKNDSQIWTKKDRAIALILSMFSWLAVISGVVTILVHRILLTDFNEDAKW